jgi:hypothetical protein
MMTTTTTTTTTMPIVSLLFVAVDDTTCEVETSLLQTESPALRCSLLLLLPLALVWVQTAVPRRNGPRHRADSTTDSLGWVCNWRHRSLVPTQIKLLEGNAASAAAEDDDDDDDSWTYASKVKL